MASDSTLGAAPSRVCAQIVAFRAAFSLPSKVLTGFCRHFRNLLSSTALLNACGRREEPVRLTPVLVLILVAFGMLQPTRLGAGVDGWTSSGPGQPYVDRVFANPFRPGRLVVGALITTDGGVTWSHSGLDANYSEYGSVIFDGLSPDTMLRLALNRPGLSVGQEPLPQVLWRTTDRGTSWYPSATGVIGAVASRSRPGLIYATHPDRLFVSTNGGRSWETRDPLGSWPKTVGDRFSNRYEMAISGEKNDTVWVAANSGLVRSTDGGWTWVDAGFAGQRISVLLAAGPDDGVVLAGDGTALWRSTDGGASWKITGPTGINRVVVHPTDNSTLYAVASGHLYRSSTAGLLWAEVSTSPWGADVAVSPGDPETLFLACGDNGLFSSQDLGVTWNPVNLGYHRPTRGLAVDPQNSSTIWASAPNFLRPAFYRSEDSAGHWISTASPLYIWNLAAGAEPSSVLYAVGSSSTYGIYGIYKSIDRGDSWQPIKEGASYYARVYVAPGNSDIVYVTGYSDAGGVYRSRNAGADWTLLNQGLVISDLAIEPSDGHHLLAVTEQGLLLSVNGGNSWSPVTDLAGLAISTVAFHPRLAGVAFVATSGSATARGRLYRSENGGNNWSLLKEVGGVLEAANRIRFDPLSDDILYVTSGYYLYKVSATKIGEPPVRFAPPATIGSWAWNHPAVITRLCTLPRSWASIPSLPFRTRGVTSRLWRSVHGNSLRDS